MLKIIYILLLFFLVGFYSIAPPDMDKTTMAVLLIVVLFSLILFAVRKEKNRNLKGQYLKHSTFVLIGIVIVSFQFPLDYVLGNISSSNLFIWVDKSIVVKSLTLSVIGLLCFFLGYLSYRKKSSERLSKPEKPASVSVLNMLALASLLTYFLTINPLYLMGHYGRVDLGVTANYAILFFQICIFASVIQKCRNMLLSDQRPQSVNQYIKQIGWLVFVLIGLYLISVLISGDRGPLIYYGLLLFSGYFFVTKRKLSWRYTLLFVFVGAFTLTILGIARGLNKDLSFADKVSRSIDEAKLGQVSSVLPVTTELAGSVLALNTAVDYVPTKHDFLYGRFQFQGLAAVVPFFSTFTPLLFNDRSVKYHGSASFITWITQGDYPTYGNGTSVMADFYFDFGLLGVILGMLTFGYCMRFAEVKMYLTEMPALFTHTFLVVYLCYAIYISRATFLFNFRTVVWVFIILIVNKYIFNRRFR